MVSKKNNFHAFLCRIAAAVSFAPICGFSSDQVIAFYDFSEGEVNESAGTIPASLGDEKYVGVATVTRQGGVVPYYADNAPAVIASNSSGDEFYLNPKALAFDYGEDTGTQTPQGGMVEFSELGKCIIGKAEPFTVEYFIRMDENFDYHDSNNQYKYMSKTSLYIGGDDDDGGNKPQDTGFKVVTPQAASSSTGKATHFSLEANSAGIKYASGDFSDGNWHHIAIVYCPGDAETGGKDVAGTLSFFVDYASIGSVAYTNAIPSHAAAFRIGTGRFGKIGTEPFHGWITCLRVTGAGLGTDDFMRIDRAPQIADMDTAGFWDFKDGMPGSEVDEVTNRIDDALFAGKASVTRNLYSPNGKLPVSYPVNEERSVARNAEH